MQKLRAWIGEAPPARDGRLSVAVDTAESRYYEEAPLPAGAEAHELSTTYRNGILQVRLGKEAV
jgi:HSP20 family molecular chaperone IbpA